MPYNPPHNRHSVGTLQGTCHALCSALLVLTAGCGKDDKPNPNPAGQTVGLGDPKPPGNTGADPTTMKPDVTMTVDEWWAECEKDPDNFDRKYKDKLIELTGVVSGVPSEASFGLRIEKGGRPVVCFVPDVWEKLGGGETVTVRGKTRLGQGPSLVDAVLVKSTPNAMPCMTATEITKANNTNFTAFKSKWNTNWVCVEGEITAVRLEAQFVLKGEGKSTVKVIVPSQSNPKVQMLKVGQRVKVLGAVSAVAPSDEVTLTQSVFKGL